MAEEGKVRQRAAEIAREQFEYIDLGDYSMAEVIGAVTDMLVEFGKDQYLAGREDGIEESAQLFEAHGESEKHTIWNTAQIPDEIRSLSSKREVKNG